MSVGTIHTLHKHFNPKSGCCLDLVDETVKTIHALGLDTNKIFDCKGNAYDLKISKVKDAVTIHLCMGTWAKIKKLSDVLPKTEPQVTSPIHFNSENIILPNSPINFNSATVVITQSIL